MQSEQRFPGNETNGTLVDLTPGEMFHIRLRAFNLGGLSPLTDEVVQYTSQNDGEFVIGDCVPSTPHTLLVREGYRGPELLPQGGTV